MNLQVNPQQRGSDPDGTVALTSKVTGPILPELLIPKTIYHRTHEPRNDVNDQEEDVTNLQTEAREEGDESSLKGRNHKG